MKKEIIPMGDLIRIDSKGFLKKNLDEKNIVSPWKDAVVSIKGEYLRNLAGKVDSIYIRGSVAKGRAIGGVSDLDTLAVVNGDLDSLDLSWIKACKESMKKQFPFLTKVEIKLYPKYDLLRKERYFPARFTIKLMSLCIYGRDLSSEIKSFKPNLEVARGLNEDLRKVREITRSALETGSESDIKTRCSWAMKRILRQGMNLVIFRERAFSRDLYICYEVFSKYYKEKEGDMRRVLELAIYPTKDKSEIMDILEGFGKWMIRETERVLQKN